MDSPYLEKTAVFSALLRQEGLAAGLQESMDACRILESAELQDRRQMKDALRTVYAKSVQEQAVFDRVFDSYFVSAEQKQANLQKRRQEMLEQARRRAQAEETLQINGKPMELPEALRETYARMPEEKQAYLRKLLENSQNNLQRNEHLYGNFIRSVFTHYLLEEQLRQEDAALNCRTLDPDMAMMFADISQFTEQEIPKATVLIEEIARRLNAELSRRRKKNSRSGALDFKQTIRRGLETGGAFYRLRFRRRKRTRRSLVILCDVSGSMLQFSEFALRFLKSISEISGGCRIFLFSEEVREVSALSMQNMDTFRTYVRQTGLYGRGTDLSAALKYLCRNGQRILGTQTTLLILSDTKTVNMTGAAQWMAEASRQAGNILWMNPIPAQKWKYIRSIQTMEQLCHMVPCSNLSELTHACRFLAGV